MGCKEEIKEKRTPFGVNLMRSQVLYWAAQVGCKDPIMSGPLSLLLLEQCTLTPRQLGLSCSTRLDSISGVSLQHKKQTRSVTYMTFCQFPPARVCVARLITLLLGRHD